MKQIFYSFAISLLGFNFLSSMNVENIASVNFGLTRVAGVRDYVDKDGNQFECQKFDGNKYEDDTSKFTNATIIWRSKKPVRFGLAHRYHIYSQVTEQDLISNEITCNQQDFTTQIKYRPLAKMFGIGLMGAALYAGYKYLSNAMPNNSTPTSTAIPAKSFVVDRLFGHFF